MDTRIILLFCSIFSTGSVSSRTLLPGSQSFVADADLPSVAKIRNPRSPQSGITSIRVKSVIVSRFSQVSVVTVMNNGANVPKQMVFSMHLPEAAFVTKFNMFVGERMYVGKVKAKEVAKAQFEKAVESGNSAGLVTAKVRETQTFSVAANVPAQSTVSFHLLYQQLLQRKLGKYDHVIRLNPTQVVDEFIVEVFVTEKTGIAQLSALPPQKGINDKDSSGFAENGVVPIETHIRRSQYQAKVTFKPTQTQQRRLLAIPEDDRKFVVRYDVPREILGGEINMRDGYFVHYFAPETIPVLRKNVVVVIDRSGSMKGKKSSQTKEAFVSMINELSENDRLNIVTFSPNVQVWKDENLVVANDRNKDEAIEYVQAIISEGGTNFNEAVLTGGRLLRGVEMDDERSSIMIVLTDGVPTVGEQDLKRIRSNLLEEVGGRFSVFCLGFGTDANAELLRHIGDENNGFFRQIYEASDADLQMKDFFKEVATPLLLHIKMKYKGQGVEGLSQSSFDKFFQGSEVIVVGKLDETSALIAEVTGVSATGNVSYEVTSSEIDEDFSHWHDETGLFSDFIERLWAYYTIRELIKKEKTAETQTEKKTITDRILELSLQYSFVTPLTSMVVTLPEDEISSTRAPQPCFGGGLQRQEHPPVCLPYIGPGIVKEKSRKSYATPTRDLMHSTPGVTHLLSASKLGNAYRQRSHSVPRTSHQIYYTTLELGNAYRQRSHSVPRTSHQIYYTSLGPMANGRLSLLNYGRMKTKIRRPNYRRTKTKNMRPKKKSCSDRITRNITLIIPSAEDNFVCTYTIRFTEGSWIDLRVKTLNTTQNKVKIQVGSEVVWSHHGGYTEPAFIPILHHTAKVICEAEENERFQPNAKILISQFRPNEAIASDATIPAIPQSTTVTCGATIRSSENQAGVITSPNFPLPYPSNSYCVWNIVNERVDDFVLQLTFDDVDVEIDGDSQCSHDRVVVRAENDGLERVLCGYNVTDVITSETESVLLLFYSDENLETRGFKARYRFLPK